MGERSDAVHIECQGQENNSIRQSEGIIQWLHDGGIDREDFEMWHIDKLGLSAWR